MMLSGDSDSGSNNGSDNDSGPGFIQLILSKRVRPIAGRCFALHRRENFGISWLLHGLGDQPQPGGGLSCGDDGARPGFIDAW